MVLKVTNLDDLQYNIVDLEICQNFGLTNILRTVIESFYNTTTIPSKGGGSTPKNPKKPKPKMGFWVFLEKGVESTYLNIPDHLRPTCFLHFFREISPGSDT